MRRKENRGRLRWVMLVVVGFFTFCWVVLAVTTPSQGAAPSPEWRSGGPYVPDGAAMTPAVVLDVEASPGYASDHTLFAATRSGLFRSTDEGLHWQLLPGLPPAGDHTYFSHIRLSPDYTTDGVIIAAYADTQTSTGTLYRSSDFGASWQPLTTFTQTVSALALSPNFAADDTLFAITGFDTYLRKSTDGGQSWQRYRFEPEEFFDGFALAVSPNYATDQTLFATGFGPVHRSSDGGVTWLALDTYGVTYGLAVSPNYAADHRVWATYRAIESPGDGTPESSVMRSFDGGENWIPTATGLPGVYEPFVRLLAASPEYASDGALFTALSGQLLAAPTHTLFRSYDHGASWVDWGPPPDNPDIFDIAVTATGTEGIVAHVATEQGVWHFHAPYEQRIVNAGFEYDSGWHFPVTAYSARYSIEEKHTGVRSALAGIRTLADNKFSYSSTQQTVTIPSDAISVILTLWWNPTSGEGELPGETVVSDHVAQAAARDGQVATAEYQPDEGLAGDRQYVLLLDEQGDVIEQLLWTRRNIGEWQPLSFDLTKYAGKTVRLHLGVYNDGEGGVTSMFVDDVALIVWRAAAVEAGPQFLPLVHNQAAPTPTPTLVPTAVPPWSDPVVPIELFAPLPGERYRSPVDVNGFSRTFEGNVYLRLLDADGNVIGQHRARGGMTGYGFFHGYVRFEVTEELSATLQVYEAAAPDQPPISLVAVPMTLEPGQRFIDLNHPASGNTVCGRVPVTGYSNTFEANVNVELTARDGSVLERGNTMGGNLGIYAEFAAYFDYEATRPLAALVGAYEVSPRDGVMVDHTRVPVSLHPPGDSACP
jgi:hypothetical protein